jgi:hypothetical protein
VGTWTGGQAYIEAAPPIEWWCKCSLAGAQCAWTCCPYASKGSVRVSQNKGQVPGCTLTTCQVLPTPTVVEGALAGQLHMNKVMSNTQVLAC